MSPKTVSLLRKLGYDVKDFGEACMHGMVLDEVRAAGYENVLAVDGYSVDGTVKVAESIGSQVAYSLKLYAFALRSWKA